jgi:hypothetical protein
MFACGVYKYMSNSCIEALLPFCLAPRSTLVFKGVQEPSGVIEI